MVFLVALLRAALRCASLRRGEPLHSARIAFESQALQKYPEAVVWPQWTEHSGERRVGFGHWARHAAVRFLLNHSSREPTVLLEDGVTSVRFEPPQTVTETRLSSAPKEVLALHWMPPRTERPCEKLRKQFQVSCRATVRAELLTLCEANH